jgi:hypothetical protein
VVDEDSHYWLALFCRTLSLSDAALAASPALPQVVASIERLCAKSPLELPMVDGLKIRSPCQISGRGPPPPAEAARSDAMPDLTIGSRNRKMQRLRP